MFAFIVGSSLPLTVLAFAGSYWGIWKRSSEKLPVRKAFGLFLILWVVMAALWLLASVLLPKDSVLNLWGPLIIGATIGRTLRDWLAEAEMRQPTSSSDVTH